MVALFRERVPDAHAKQAGLREPSKERAVPGDRVVPPLCVEGGVGGVDLGFERRALEAGPGVGVVRGIGQCPLIRRDGCVIGAVVPVRITDPHMQCRETRDLGEERVVPCDRLVELLRVEGRVRLCQLGLDRCWVETLEHRFSERQLERVPDPNQREGDGHVATLGDRPRAFDRCVALDLGPEVPLAADQSDDGEPSVVAGRGLEACGPEIPGDAFGRDRHTLHRVAVFVDGLPDDPANLRDRGCRPDPDKQEGDEDTRIVGGHEACLRRSPVCAIRCPGTREHSTDSLSIRNAGENRTSGCAGTLVRQPRRVAACSSRDHVRAGVPARPGCRGPED